MRAQLNPGGIVTIRAFSVVVALSGCGGEVSSAADGGSAFHDGSVAGSGDAALGANDGSTDAPTIDGSNVRDSALSLDAGDGGVASDACVPIRQACGSGSTCCPTGPLGSSCQGGVCNENHGQ